MHILSVYDVHMFTLITLLFGLCARVKYIVSRLLMAIIVWFIPEPHTHTHTTPLNVLPRLD